MEEEGKGNDTIGKERVELNQESTQWNPLGTSTCLLSGSTQISVFAFVLPNQYGSVRRSVWFDFLGLNWADFTGALDDSLREYLCPRFFSLTSVVSEDPEGIRVLVSEQHPGDDVMEAADELDKSKKKKPE